MTRAPFPWFGNAMLYALTHVAFGVLEIDDRGCVWRKMINAKGKWVDLPGPRRMENIGGKGYLRVSLQKPGGGLSIVMAHRLVYEVRVGAIPCGMQINHKNLNKQDNAIENLEVVTAAGNIQHSYANGRTKPWIRATEWRGRDRLSEGRIAEARSARKMGVKLKDIALMFKISVTHAQRITTDGYIK